MLILKKEFLVQFDENGNVGLASDLEIPNFANFPNFLQDLPNSIMTTQSYLISLKMRIKSLLKKTDKSSFPKNKLARIGASQLSHNSSTTSMESCVKERKNEQCFYWQCE